MDARFAGGRLGPEDAQALAIDALGFIAADAELLERFLSTCGIGPQTLRAAAGEPGFLGAVTGYLMANESVLLAFTANAGLPADAVGRAHALLTSDAGAANGGW
ncbi:MAG: DUF3572 domain-containing protein [Rhodobiaceae bacterium]|nr:DUF3572 domain-containing protein [Rhodobiaceae bacterium]MCC0017346.1 DUF3572 domain-containing protein [Rhodobiaceae bacterium]MCC0041802.1 DUF3572 domain-containing protein [Rhodobiaceae bacterium]MCC0052518.1 DUF3572 domain-containing protein [Rhodobiaceae bacterium]